MMNKQYFDEHVMMAIEVEGDYGRHWVEKRGSEVDAYCNRIEKFGDCISDMDYCTHQPDEWVRKVLNTAEYNWTHNRDWVKKNGFKGFWEVIDWIIDRRAV